MPKSGAVQEEAPHLRIREQIIPRPYAAIHAQRTRGGYEPASHQIAPDPRTNKARWTRVTMRSISGFLWMVIDGEINTPEQGAALLDEEAREYAGALQITEAEARAQLLANIESAAGLCLRSEAEKLRRIFAIGKEPNGTPGAGMPVSGT
jgi:hypothetical protein